MRVQGRFSGDTVEAFCEPIFQAPGGDELGTGQRTDDDIDSAGHTRDEFPAGIPEPPGELVSHNCIPDGFAYDQSDSRGISRRLRMGGGAGNVCCTFLIAVLSCGVDNHASVVHLYSGANYSAEVRAPMETVLLRKH